MELFFSVLAVLLMFIVVVGLHEAGHALAAFWCGVKIQRIALGFGKVIYSKTDKHGIVCDRPSLESGFELLPLFFFVCFSNSIILVCSCSIKIDCFSTSCSRLVIFSRREVTEAFITSFDHI